MHVAEFRDIPLNQLEIGRFQVRTRDTDKEIQDLSDSIDKVGLIEPIVVAPAEKADGKFQVVAGQRRLQACQKLGHKTIKAGILSERPDIDLGKAIGLTENMVRVGMNQKDCIDACTALYRRYGSIRAVRDEVGLPVHRISEYVKFDQLIPALRIQVTEEGLDMKIALQAQKAARDPTTHEVDEKKAEELATEMKSLSNVQRNNMIKAAQETPGASTQEIIEKGRKPPQERMLKITIGSSSYSSLERYAQEESNSTDEAALTLIEKGLEDLGYTSPK